MIMVMIRKMSKTSPNSVSGFVPLALTQNPLRGTSDTPGTLSAIGLQPENKVVKIWR